MLNLDGKNVNPCVRRFSLAHETYHLLVDWDRGTSLATVSGYVEDWGFDREQRANSFATRFICPEAVLNQMERGKPLAAVQTLIKDWGFHYAAARLYLENAVVVPKGVLPDMLPVEMHAALDSWKEREEPLGIRRFPIVGVPEERRTIVAELAAQAYARGRICRGAFAEFLDVTESNDLERVVDFFGLGFEQAASDA